MPACTTRVRRPTTAVFAAAVLAVLVAVSSAPLHADDEVRALWVVRTSLTSPASIQTMVNAAKASGFNTLLVQIRGRGDAYYQHALEPRPAALAAQADFDPLETTIARAHAAGLQVHAWISVNLVASAVDLPGAREHVVYRHPEWLMVPRALVSDLADVDVHGPEFLGRLARYVRGHKDVEGLYLSPMAPGAAEYTSSIVRDIADRYAIDGVHLDYIRYPDAEFDYSREALTAFRRSLLNDLSVADQKRYDARMTADPLIYTEAFPERWHAFRTAKLSALVAQIAQAVKRVRPAARVSAAVMPDLAEAATSWMQNWRDWLTRDLVDVVCPMAYTTDASTFAAQVTAARAAAGSHAIWAGIGAYRLSSAQILENIQTARRLGANGVILFSYDSLTEPSLGRDYLAQVGRAAFSNP